MGMNIYVNSIRAITGDIASRFERKIMKYKTSETVTTTTTISCDLKEANEQWAQANREWAEANERACKSVDELCVLLKELADALSKLNKSK